EGTQPVVFTEIEVVHSSHTLFDTHNSTGYAACLTHVLPGLIKGDALGKNQRRRKQGDEHKRGDSAHLGPPNLATGVASFHKQDFGKKRIQRTQETIKLPARFPKKEKNKRAGYTTATRHKRRN